MRLCVVEVMPGVQSVQKGVHVLSEPGFGVGLKVGSEENELCLWDSLPEALGSRPVARNREGVRGPLLSLPRADL